MAAKDPTKQPITLLRSAFSTLAGNPSILFPFACIAFIQFFLLELIFFTPRFPLNIFFGRIIVRLAGEAYLHYPFNFLLLTKWFQMIQIPLYILCNSFFLGAAVIIIALINNEKTVHIKNIFRQALASYIHLFVAAGLSIALMSGLSFGYTLLMQRAAIIRSTSGIFYVLKRIVFDGAPYVNLLTAVFVTAIFAFVIPAIVLEKKKIFSALRENFKMLGRSFFFIFVVILLPAILYVPILLIRSNNKIVAQFVAPETWGWLIIVSVLVTLLIDAMQYTAITIYYLVKKESK